MRTAEVFFQKVTEAIESITLHPFAKPIYLPQRDDLGKRFRFTFVTRSYRLVYKVYEDKYLIKVFNISHRNNDSGSIISKVSKAEEE